MIRISLLLLVGFILTATIIDTTHRLPTPNYEKNSISDTASVDTVFSMDSIVSEKTLVKFCKDRNIKHIAILVAQAKFESNFRSNVFKENNNLFGMKLAGQRPTTANGRKNGYAFYDNWKMSVFDYVLWQEQNVKGKTEEQYLKVVESIYASSTIVAKLKPMIRQLKTKYSL